MGSRAKAFLKTYGVVGVGVYGSVTAVSILSLYVGIRTNAELLVSPLEGVLGSDSDTVIDLKERLRGTTTAAANKEQHPRGESIGSTTEDNNNSIDFVKEGTYLGIATVLDSFVLPFKLALCMPLARYILKRRGGK